MTSSNVIFLRNASTCGLVASPITRICSLVGPTKVVTTTVTTGSRMYLPSAFSMSRDSCAGVLSSADRSSTSGRADLAIGSHGNRHGQFRIAPDNDVDGVQRTDLVIVIGRGSYPRRRRIGRVHRATGGQHQASDADEKQRRSGKVGLKKWPFFPNRHHDFPSSIAARSDVNTGILRYPVDIAHFERVHSPAGPVCSGRPNSGFSVGYKNCRTGRRCPAARGQKWD